VSASRRFRRPVPRSAPTSIWSTRSSICRGWRRTTAANLPSSRRASPHPGAPTGRWSARAGRRPTRHRRSERTVPRPPAALAWPTPLRSSRGSGIGACASRVRTDEKSVSRRAPGQCERIAHCDARRVAILILHRVASAEVRRARVSDDGTDASEHPAQAGRSPARLLRCREVCARTGLSRTTLWRLECRGQFPSRRQPTTNTVGWLETEVEGWIATRVSPRDRHAK
jgi:prophage regulatory protein